MNYIESVTIIAELDSQINSLQKQSNLGIISAVDAAEEIAMINNKKFKIKKQLVDAVHARAISEHGATSGYPNGYFYTRMDGRKIIKAKDIVSLYDKLYKIYYGQCDSPYSLKSIFYEAIDEKKKTENPKQLTITKLRNDFNRFINDDLAGQNIADIDHIKLKQYTQNLVNSISITKKQFLAYKCVLNLIFGYAIEHDIISVNPLNKVRNAVYLKSCDSSIAKPEEKIFTQDEIQLLINVCEERMKDKYYVNGYAMKFAICTGVRVGELCAIKWSDIDFDAGIIHIHGQQLLHRPNGHNEYYYVLYTKNERGISEDGRYFPLTNELRYMLIEMREWQDKLGINPEFVFSTADGEWIKTVGYESFLRRICRRCGLNITNNHAFRMSFNSNVLIQNGIAATDRAKLLGHSVTTNLNCYSFAQKDVVEKVRCVLNTLQTTKEPNPTKKEPLSVIHFDSKKALKRLV